jgi:pimeloyl-ACP methyl ester carboxylesterase
VAVKHQPVINLIEWVNRTFGINAGDRVLFINSLGFDLSVYDIFGLLAAGGSIRIASREELQDPLKLLYILFNEPITFWNSAPAALSQLIPFHNFSLPSFTRLRLAFLSGDWIPLSMPDWIRTSFPGTQVVSLGGATEATVWSNYYPIGRVEGHWASIPYGVPIQNARYHILDHYLEPVPVGVTGNLYIGGNCLAEGYFRRPELTADRFIPDPFSPHSGARLYKTGDLARYWPDGNIEFLGRADHQVKIRGYRVEPGEIEAVLNQREDLQEVLVVAGPDPAGGKRLIAYFVPGSGQFPDPRQLRMYLMNKLPAYMIPAAFVPVEAFPLNSSGKIDRKALPAPDMIRESTDEYVPATNSTEILLAQIWQRVLQIDKIGVRTNFFQSGGHSLAAGQVISHLHQITGRLLPLSAIFANPTIQQLSAVLDENSASQSWTSLVTVRKGSTRAPLLCVHPVSGDVEYAFKLASFLPDDQPVYGILARGINGVDEPFPTIEEAAAAYVEQVTDSLPPGRIFLAGYSYGGYVAWEMARQLQCRGYQIENLILFDTYLINQARTYRNYPAKYVLLSCIKLVFSVHNLRDFFRNQYWRGLVRKCRPILKVASHRAGLLQFPQFEGIKPQAPEDAFTPGQSGLSFRDQVRERLYGVLTTAVRAYRFDTYSGDVVFIRAMEGAARYLRNFDFGWSKKIQGKLAVYDVQGVDHFNLFRDEKNVMTIALLVKKHLEGPGQGDEEPRHYLPSEKG